MSDAPADASNPEPPRREWRLKPREFVRENPPVSTPAPGPTDVREHFLAAGQSTRTPPSAVPVRENDVHGILRDNLAAANAAGLNDVKPVVRRRSRRRRDYWITLLAIDGTLLALMLPNVISVLFGFSGIVLFSVGFTWVMWFVMDDY